MIKSYRTTYAGEYKMTVQSTILNHHKDRIFDEDRNKLDTTNLKAEQKFHMGRTPFRGKNRFSRYGYSPRQNRPFQTLYSKLPIIQGTKSNEIHTNRPDKYDHATLAASQTWTIHTRASEISRYAEEATKKDTSAECTAPDKYVSSKKTMHNWNTKHNQHKWMPRRDRNIQRIQPIEGY